MKHTVQRSALVNYSAQQMFDLVNDIEAYPSYMDGCVSSRILGQDEDWVEAELVLGKAGIQQAFVTRNVLNSPHTISMQLVDGPFKSLNGLWTFTALAADACKVSFSLDFEMQNRLLGMAAGKLFESVSSKQVDSLVQRAKVVYA